jgi:hypothetical protein
MPPLARRLALSSLLDSVNVGFTFFQTSALGATESDGFLPRQFCDGYGVVTPGYRRGSKKVHQNGEDEQ